MPQSSVSTSSMTTNVKAGSLPSTPTSNSVTPLISAAFWLINGGLMAMVLLSLLPVGLLQTRASVEVGYWYARSAEFLHTELMNDLRWLRVVGDTAFAIGAVLLTLFVAGLATGHSHRPRSKGSSAPEVGVTSEAAGE